VDSECRVLQRGGNTLTKVFGIGIAFPLQLKEGVGPGLKMVKSDSFSLYIKKVSGKVISNLLPK